MHEELVQHSILNACALRTTKGAVSGVIALAELLVDHSLGPVSWYYFILFGRTLPSQAFNSVQAITSTRCRPLHPLLFSMHDWRINNSDVWLLELDMWIGSGLKLRHALQTILY